VQISARLGHGSGWLDSSNEREGECEEEEERSSSVRS
jgi:hypothetical protein